MTRSQFAGSELRRRPGLAIFFLFLLVGLLSGCAGKLNRASDYFYADRPEQALEVLNQGDNWSNRSQLLFLMEKGVVLHQLGRYQESVEVLLKAVALIDEFELISASEQVGSVMTSEWLVRYKGEYSERLWVHSYLMMNYLLLNRFDDALVEAKQALKRLGQQGKALQDDYFTRSLIALCYSLLGEDNDALLVYRQLAKDLPNPTPVAADLVKHAARLGMNDLVQQYQPYAHGAPAGEAELVVFLATGQIPVKQPGNVVLPPTIRFSFPFYPVRSAPEPRVNIQPAPIGNISILSTDLNQVARQSLEVRKAGIIAKETVRVGAKEATARAVGRNSGEVAEAMTRITLFLLEEPDTRCWQTLPARLSLIRIPLSAGVHQLRLRIPGSGRFASGQIELPEIELRRGQHLFYSLRR